MTIKPLTSFIPEVLKETSEKEVFDKVSEDKELQGFNSVELPDLSEYKRKLEKARVAAEYVLEHENRTEKGRHLNSDDILDRIIDYFPDYPEYQISKSSLSYALREGAKDESCRLESQGSGGHAGFIIRPGKAEVTTDKSNTPLHKDHAAIGHNETMDINEDEELIEPYGLDDIVKDGCFIDIERLQNFMGSLERKKNIVLQGPPGTGKTWLAKRLAYALMGERATQRLHAVQFHPNLSYEDFVQGWRPDGEGGLKLTDGVLMEMIRDANDNPDNTFVLVIEEVNRGNPAQIFGEMLTLLEADKRNSDEAMTLCYQDRKADGYSPVYIPPNLFVICTMNIADRSLAIVDFALRRRFAFIDLYPELKGRWKTWLFENNGIAPEFVENIQQKLQDLNKELSSDSSLGEQFQIGHSYVTPSKDHTIENAEGWFEQVVKTEITPLLKEYWFDEPRKVEKAEKQLLADFDLE